MSFVPHPTMEEMQQPGFNRRYIMAMAEASAEYEARMKREAEEKATKGPEK